MSDDVRINQIITYLQTYGPQYDDRALTQQLLEAGYSKDEIAIARQRFRAYDPRQSIGMGTAALVTSIALAVFNLPALFFAILVLILTFSTEIEVFIFTLVVSLAVIVGEIFLVRWLVRRNRGDRRAFITAFVITFGVPVLLFLIGFGACIAILSSMSFT